MLVVVLLFSIDEINEKALRKACDVLQLVLLRLWVIFAESSIDRGVRISNRISASDAIQCAGMYDDGSALVC